MHIIPDRKPPDRRKPSANGRPPDGDEDTAANIPDPQGGGRKSTDRPTPPPTPGKPVSPPKPPADRGTAVAVVPPADTRDSRDSRAAGGTGGVVADVSAFLARYVVLADATRDVTALWVAAAHLADVWDRFPNLAVTSPEKRCGKTRLLQLLELVTPNARNVANISPAAVYRLIAAERPTLLIDEAQSLVRRGSENTEVLRELLCSGIDRNAKVLRCGGANNDEVMEFAVYAPKVIALIGQPDGVVADRCLPVAMKRMTGDDRAERYVSRVVEPVGHAVRDRLAAWAVAVRDDVQAVYDRLEPFDIENDRMAELLMPLMAVAEVDGGGHLDVLRQYADDLDRADAEAERMSPGVRLLAACREIFRAVADAPGDGRFLATANLIAKLVARTEEPWAAYVRGQAITPEALATLLRPYGIHSAKNRKQTFRGYTAHAFAEAWGRYLAPPKKPG